MRSTGCRIAACCQTVKPSPAYFQCTPAVNRLIVPRVSSIHLDRDKVLPSSSMPAPFINAGVAGFRRFDDLVAQRKLAEKTITGLKWGKLTHALSKADASNICLSVQSIVRKALDDHLNSVQIEYTRLSSSLAKSA